MSDLTPITREERLLNGEFIEPKTREEMILAGKDLDPKTRREYFLKKYRGADVEVDSLTATENKTYTAPTGKAYSPVTVNVPVPTLSSLSVSENGTYTAPSGTAYNEVDVDVPLPSNAYLLKEIEDVEIATFDDGSDLPMPKLEVGIEPVQDLHGYDAPWVGGSGKNKQMTPEAENVAYRNGGNMFTLSFNNGVITFTVTGVASTFFDIKAFEIKSEHVGKTYTMSYVASPSLDNSNCIFETWDGTTRVSMDSKTVTITNDMVGKWLCCKYYKYGVGTYTISNCQVEEGQTATSYAPYENICPINGWDEVNVSDAGVNVWDEEWEVGRWSLVTGDKTTSVNSLRCKNPIPVKPNETFYFKNDYTVFVGGFDANNNFIGQLKATDNTTSIKNKSVLMPNNCYFVVFYTDNTNTYNNDISINYPSTDTSYHAYNGQVITIDLDGTRYGGTLDLVSGVLTVDRAYQNLGDLIWQISSNGHFYATISNPKVNTDTSNIPNIICSIYQTASVNTVYNKTVDGSITQGTSGYWGTAKIATYDSRYNDADAYKTAMSGVQLVYELATPITIQLTPTMVKSLRGKNNVFTDSGNILDLNYLAKEE